MYNKKAQSQIITIVLIILLVLAAIVIIWIVIQNTIESGSENIEGTTLCITTKLSIVSATISSVDVKRGAGSGLIDVKVVVRGRLQTLVDNDGNVFGLDITPLETRKNIPFDGPLDTFSKFIEIAPVVTDSKGNKVICDITDEIFVEGDIPGPG